MVNSGLPLFFECTSINLICMTRVLGFYQTLSPDLQWVGSDMQNYAFVAPWFPKSVCTLKCSVYSDIVKTLEQQ